MFDGKTIHTLQFTSIHSTNSWVKEHVQELDAKALTCITAEEQTAGRGQQSKKWLSPPGNLYTTWFFVLPTSFPYVSNLGQVLSVSIAHALQDFGLAPKLKWPNDILLAEKKAGGILSETLPLGSGIGAILGFGINVAVTPSVTDQRVTSLAEELQKPPAIPALLHAILDKFLPDLATLRTQGFAPFTTEFNKLLAFQDKEVILTTTEGKVQGICLRIDEHGHLVLRSGW